MSESADPTSPTPGDPAEEEAWTRVLASWGDEAVHRAYLSRFADLEGCAVAGSRYRAVLAERPEDAMGQRMRAELLRKATVLGLASLPRTARREAPRWVRRLIVLAAILIGVAAIGFAAAVMRGLLGARS